MDFDYRHTADFLSKISRLFINQGDYYVIFEKGWFLHKMNKHAPRGYKFVAIGDDGRIAMYAPEFMGNRSPMGPFLSCFSFDLLDHVYGGLMTRRSSHMSQGALPIDYIYSYELTRPQNVSPDAKYEIYRSVAAQHMLLGVFFDHGTPVIPKLPRNKVMQMLQLLCMRETKLKNK